MTCVLTEPSRSIREYRLLPGLTGHEHTIGNMSLKTRLCRCGEGFLHLNIPLISAAMQAVTGTAMATALSALGGVGVLPLSASADEQCAAVRAVKRFKAGFQEDLNRHISHPQATVDDRERHIVGAAVSTYEQDRPVIEALIKSEVDFFVLDASHGHTAYQQDALAWIKKRWGTPVVAGNVVTADGFYHLARSGADAVKIGMGIGSGCITQAVKSTGRGQATAIMEVAAARDAYLAETGAYVPLVADGGLISAAEIVLALAMGADTVMMGNFFARFSESPGPLLETRGRRVKAYWMEASAKALNYRRYYQSPATFFEEGISGFVPYEGSLYETLPSTLHKIKAAFSTAGAGSVEELHRTAVLERQSFSALNDAAIHNIQPEGQGGLSDVGHRGGSVRPCVL